MPNPPSSVKPSPLPPRPVQDGPLRTLPARRGPPPVRAQMAPHLARLAKRSGAMDPQLAERWDEVAGDVAPLCRPVRLRRGRGGVTLEVQATSGAAAMRVEYAQSALLARARTVLGEPNLKRLRVTQRGRTGERQWASKRVTAEEATASPQAPARSASEALERMRAAMAERLGD